MTNVLITGGSRGIGYELVKQFAQKPNYYIVVLSRNINKLQILQEECFKLFHTNISIHQIDLLALDVELKIKDIVKKENRHFNIVINNAGILINKPFNDLLLDDWAQTFRVNFFAPVTIIREVIQNNNNEHPLHIVNISSMGGFQGSSKFSGLTSYSSSKAALANLTEVLAEEYKGTKITLNCLALGSVQTEMLKEAFPEYNSSMPSSKMAEFIIDFSINGNQYFNGKVIPVSLSTP